MYECYLVLFFNLVITYLINIWYNLLFIKYFFEIVLNKVNEINEIFFGNVED